MVVVRFAPLGWGFGEFPGVPCFGSKFVVFVRSVVDKILGFVRFASMGVDKRW